MKDSKNVLDLKHNAMSGTKANSGASTRSEGGFKLYHLLLTAVIGLMLGAYLQTTLFNQVQLPVVISAAASETQTTTTTTTTNKATTSPPSSSV